MRLSGRSQRDEKQDRSLGVGPQGPDLKGLWSGVGSSNFLNESSPGGLTFGAVVSPPLSVPFPYHPKAQLRVQAQLTAWKAAAMTEAHGYLLPMWETWL